MRIVLLGSPGAGKGTQARCLMEKYQIPFISTGSMLRAEIGADTDLGKIVKKYLDVGELIPDPMMIDMVNHRLSQDDCKSGFILDGFPRTINQAKILAESKILVDYIIEIYIPDAEVIKRLTGRLVHPPSGRVYHLSYNPPKKAGFDDITGEPLVIRDDDNEETIKKRLRVYREKTKPLTDFYQKLFVKNNESGSRYVRIDGIGAVEAVWQRILDVLGINDK